MGDLAQCRGVARALTSQDEIVEHVVDPNWITSLPLPSMPISAVDRQQEFFSMGADIIVASGRRTVPYLRALKNLQKPVPFTVFLKDPRFNRQDIDFIWAPDHDKLEGDNVFSTLTSPHALDLETASKSAVKRFSEFGSPVVGVILGGDSKNVTWTSEDVQALAKALSDYPLQTRFLITPSRRTPDILRQAVLNVCEDRNFWFWNGEEENPYQQILSHCDRLIVTGDSHNMVSEALSADKPVHVFRPKSLHPKLTYFLDALTKDGLIKDVDDMSASSSTVAVDSTPEIADEILKRYSAFQSSRNGVGQTGG